MHEQHREDAKQRRHTGSEPSCSPRVGVDSPRLKWFNQGGRKICVGDTALFRAGNALPFIGIIRKVITDKDGALKLRVNWLYRPCDIELVKGFSLDASPNEVFYSFHKDVISAASLLHPCKVAFLPNGVELPPDVSSLVCRRVYDTSRKCLYWLTDRDYADEHQGEVDRLLKKTKHEMQSADQPEKPSPRALSEVKTEAAHVAQCKSKKRERTDHIMDSTKRERHSKEENMEPKREQNLRFEDFAFIAEKQRGLSNTSLVDQLVQVMVQERIDAPKDLINVVPHRIHLVGIVAAMDKDECLSHFVRCGGLPVLDDWLQEAHKGSLGDYKENNRTLEELLFILLRALERLPVDIDALRASNVGKSVNLLKSHKNFELQKKARKLVETWKKQVNAEMNQLDETKFGPNGSTAWSSRPGVETLTMKGCFTGVSKGSLSPQTANDGSAAAGEVHSISACKDLMETSASKANSLKAPASGASDVLAAVKEEKSCSSSQSWCSGSGKSVGSLKEEGTVPSVGSFGNKPGTALRSHSKGHCPAITTSTTMHKDSAGKHKTSGVERLSNTMLSDKKGNEVPSYSTQRLIVRLPNPGRSPAHSASGGCLIDGGGSSNKGSSSAVMERHDSVNTSNKTSEIHSSGTSRDAKCANAAIKSGNAGFDHKEDVSRSCIDLVDDVDYKSTDIKHRSRNLSASKSQPAAHVNSSKRGTNLSVITTTPGSSNICVNGVSGGIVEGGIDLLASVAACEGSEAEKSIGETARGDGHHPPITENNRDMLAQVRLLDEQDRNVKAQVDGDQKSKSDVSVSDCKPRSENIRKADPAESNVVPLEPHQEVIRYGTPSSSVRGKEEGRDVSEAVIESNKTHGNHPSVAEVTAATQDALIATEEVGNDGGTSRHEGDCRAPETQTDDCQVSTPSALDNVASLQDGSENGSKDLPSPNTPKAFPSHTDTGDIVSEFFGEDALEVARQVAKEVEQEVQRYGGHEAHGASLSSSDGKNSNLDGDESLKQQKQNDTDDAVIRAANVKKLVDDGAPAEGKVEAGMEDRNLDNTFSSKNELLDTSATSPMNDALCRPDSEVALDSSSLISNNVAKSEVDSQSFANAVSKAVLIEEISSEKEAFLYKSRKPKVVDRPVFDLNEGLASEESHHDCVVTNSLAPVSSPTPMLERMSTSHSGSLAAPVAIVSAMKGSFIPPCNIPRPKVELGWKGSAATSAFRPAEPRRTAETLQPGSDAVIALEPVVADDQDGRQARMLDIDLNVPDDEVIEETNLTSMCDVDAVSNGPAASRPELDLNRVDESDESPMLPQSNGRSPIMTVRAMLDFDLNDGLGCSEDAGAEEVSSHHCTNFEVSSLPVLLETRSMADSGNVVPWYNSNSMPAAMMVPAFATNRPDFSYPVVETAGPKSACTASKSFSQFGGNMYQGMAPISSVNVGYPPTTFPQAGYPLGGGFPLATASYSVNSVANVAVNNTLTFPPATPSLVSAGGVLAPFGRSYLSGCIRDGPGGDSLVSWSRPSLDLNADVITELDSKDESYSVRSSIGQLQYPQVGALNGHLKRKETEGGFDPFRSSFKQMAWRE